MKTTRVDLSGSAGILPAAVGMLPAGRTLDAEVERDVVSNAVRQNAGQGGQHARAPQTMSKSSAG
jgi:hypothetical protein